MGETHAKPNVFFASIAESRDTLSDKAFSSKRKDFQTEQSGRLNEPGKSINLLSHF